MASGFVRIPTSNHAVVRMTALRHALHVTFWVVAWYTLSISMTIYNKWLFSLYGLAYPLLITTTHFALKSGLARAALTACALPRPTLSCTTASGRAIMLTAAATAADVALSNQAFLFISVTTYTIIKSSVPVWILIFSVCLGLRKLELRLALVLLLIIGGIGVVVVDPYISILSPLLDSDRDAASGGDRSSSHSTGRRVSRTLVEHFVVAHAHRLLLRERSVDVTPFANASAPNPYPHIDTTARAASSTDATVGKSVGDQEGSRSETRRMIGIALVMMAALCAGCRWAVSQLLMSRDADANDSGQGASDGAAAMAARAEGGGATRDSNAAASDAVHLMAHEPGRAASGDDSPPRTVTVRESGSTSPEAAGSDGGLHAFALVFGTALWGVPMLLPVAVAVEARDFAAYLASLSPATASACMGLSAVGGALAFLLLVAELRLVKLTSALSLSVAGDQSSNRPARQPRYLS